LLHLTLDLTRRRLDIFAEIGAAEVVKGVVSPPTPGTETWWRATAAVRKAVYALRQRGLVQYVREAEGSTGQARPADKPAPYKTANCEERRAFPPFFSSSLSRDAE